MAREAAHKAEKEAKEAEKKRKEERERREARYFRTHSDPFCCLVKSLGEVIGILKP